MKQTTIQTADAIRKGSIRVLVGTSFASLVDVGALRNPVITSLAENQSIEFDNVDSLKKFVKGKRVQVTFDLAEINLENMSILDGGILNLTNTPGSATAVTAEAKGTGWTVGTPIKLNNKNGDNTVVTSIVVKAGVPTLTAGTDYSTYVADGSNGEKGYTYILPISAQTLAITVSYSYTPTASRKVTFNDSGTKDLVVMRIVNVNEDGQEFRIDINEGTNFAPISLDFAGDEEDDVAIMAIDFQGNLVEWVDEQA